MNLMSEIIRNLWKRKGTVFFIAIQVMLSIVFFIECAYVYQRIFYVDIAVSDNLRQEKEQVLHMSLNVERATPENYLKFRERVLKEDGVIEIGKYRAGSCVELSEGTEDSGMEFTLLEMEPGMEKLSELQVIEGQEVSFDEKINENEVLPIYAGYELYEQGVVTLGMKLYRQEPEKTYQVVGILKPGSKWFDKNLSNGEIQCIDEMLVVPQTIDHYQDIVVGGMNMHYYCILEQGIDTEKVMQNIKRIADEVGVPMEINSIEQELSVSRQNSVKENVQWIIFSGFFLFMTSIGIASIMVMLIVSRKKEIGIRYAMGYSNWQIQRLFCGELLVLILFSAAVAIVLEIVSTNSYASSIYGLNMSGYRLSVKIIAGAIGITIAMCIPSVVAISLKLRNVQPRELIGGRE